MKKTAQGLFLLLVVFYAVIQAGQMIFNLAYSQGYNDGLLQGTDDDQ